MAPIPTTGCVEMEVRYVLLDAMSVLLRTVAPSEELVARIVRDLTGVNVSPPEVARRTTALCRLHTRGNRVRAYWPEVVNPRLLSGLGISLAEYPTLPRAIHDRLTGTPEFYEVGDDLRAFLGWATAQGIEVGVTSDHRHRSLRALLQQKGVLSRFEHGGRTSNVFTAERVGASRLRVRFWREVRRRLRATSREVVHVGGNLEHGTPSAHAGIRTAILDRSGAYSALRVPLPRGTTSVRSVEELQRWIIAINEHR